MTKQERLEKKIKWLLSYAGFFSIGDQPPTRLAKAKEIAALPKAERIATMQRIMAELKADPNNLSDSDFIYTEGANE